MSMKDNMSLASLYNIALKAEQDLMTISYPVPIDKKFVDKYHKAMSAVRELKHAADCEIRGLYYD